MDRWTETDGLTNMNSQDFPANMGVRKIFKKNTKIIDKSKRNEVFKN